MEGTDGAIREARRLFAADPQRYFYADQYNNDANWRAHYETTGPEILEQTEGRITHFVAGLGTSGTFMGVGRRLREYNPRHPADLGAAGFADARRRRAEAHGDGHQAGHLRRSSLADEDRPGHDRGGLRLHPASGARGRACWSACRAAPRWPRALELAARIRTGVIVVDLSRQRHAIPDRAVLGGGSAIDAGSWRPRRKRKSAATAGETYPNECCGALIAAGEAIVEAFPAAQHDGGGRTPPVPDRARGLPAGRGAARASGAASSPASTIRIPIIRPGRRRHDLAQAWPNLTYIIVAVRAGMPGDLKSWRLLEDRSGFEEEI